MLRLEGNRGAVPCPIAELQHRAVIACCGEVYFFLMDHHHSAENIAAESVNLHVLIRVVEDLSIVTFNQLDGIPVEQKGDLNLKLLFALFVFLLLLQIHACTVHHTAAYNIF